MLLPKSTLEQISHYSLTTETVSYTGVVDDVVTLHFKRWWKHEQEIRIRRNTTEVDEKNDIFYHQSSEEALILFQQIEDYMASTFDDSPELRQKADVLQLVVDNDKV